MGVTRHAHGFPGPAAGGLATGRRRVEAPDRPRGEDVALAYAEALLAGTAPRRGASLARANGEHPLATWARCGAMALTGPRDGAPVFVGPALASAARGALLALAALEESDVLAALDGASLLAERAALTGLRRAGRQAPGGACRLLRAADGWLAVSLARREDVASLPAWLGPGDSSDPWAYATPRLARRPLRDALVRARLLGLPVAPAARGIRSAPWLRVGCRGRPRRASRPEAPLVIDLSSLWAGPLCTQLLRLCGARVLKVESTSRPDAVRDGAPRFFDLLHAGKESVALDLRTETGRRSLRALLERADLVVESARPRALRQLGLDAEAWVRQRPGRTWLGITGYGRARPMGDWVAFGDDAAAAAGLAFASLAPAGTPLFCADAIADPLTGLHAALAARLAWHRGGGVLLDVSLCDVTRHAAAFHRERRAPALESVGGGFAARLGGEVVAVAAPRARRPAGYARPLGADTRAVLRELAPRC